MYGFLCANIYRTILFRLSFTFHIIDNYIMIIGGLGHLTNLKMRKEFRKKRKKNEGLEDLVRMFNNNL